MKSSEIKIDRWFTMPLYAVVVALLLTLPAVAQDDKGRSRKSRERDRSIEREKWKQKFDLKDYLGKLDSDKSGVLDSDELKNDRTRQFLARLGINAEGPVKIDAAVKKAEAAYANKRDAERKKFEDQVTSKLNTFGTQKEVKGIESFGATDDKEPVVASFEQRLTGLKVGDFEEHILADARKLLNGYDRDKSGFLEGDEINRIRWKNPTPAESDLNSDGRISLLEMAKRLQDSSDADEDRLDREERDYNRRSRGDDRRDRDYDRGNRGDDRRSRGKGRRNRDYDRENRDYDREDRDYNRGSRGDDRRDRDYDRGDDGGDRGYGQSNRDYNSRRPEASGYGRSPRSGREDYDESSDERSNQAGSRSESSRAKRDGAFTNYINGVFDKYDIDGDDQLSLDELKKMRRPLKGDRDADGFLSKTEATDFIKSKQNNSGKSGASNDRDRSGGSNRGNGKERYTPPKASGSRSGGKSRGGGNSHSSLGKMDTNSDGQIQMAEFSSTWDEATLQKFREADVDQDGIISADEWSSRGK